MNAHFIDKRHEIDVSLNLFGDFHLETSANFPPQKWSLVLVTMFCLHLINNKRQ